MKFTKDESYFFICETGQYLRDCKITKLSVKDGEFKLVSKYQHDKPLQDLFVDDKNNKLYVLDVIIGGPVDLRKSKVIVLDIETMQVVHQIEKLQPSLHIHLSRNCSRILYKEEKGPLIKVHDIDEDKSL